MTYNEYKFFEKDEKKYELKNNREFLNWFLNSIEGGVKPNRYTKFEDFEGFRGVQDSASISRDNVK